MTDASSLNRDGQGLVYVLSESGEQSVHEEKQVHDMLAQRILTPETLFWKEGMTEWRPLSELPAPAIPSFVPPKRTGNSMPVSQTASQSVAIPAEQIVSQVISRATDKASPSAEAEPAVPWRRPVIAYDFENNPIPRTVILQILIGLSIGATAYFIFRCLGKILGWSGLSHDDVRFLDLFFLSLLAFHLIVEIVFFVWIYYTNENCRGFARNMTYTSGWAVGWFFVPLMNLFRPYQVMQEMWKVSESPQGWNGTRDSIFVGVWFVIRLISFVLGRGHFHTSFDDSDVPAVRELGSLVNLATLETHIVLMELTTLILISVITWRQIKLVRSSDEHEV